MPDIKTFEGNWPAQQNSMELAVRVPSPLFFHHLQPVHGERRAFLAVTKGPSAAADQR